MSFSNRRTLRYLRDTLMQNETSERRLNRLCHYPLKQDRSLEETAEIFPQKKIRMMRSTSQNRHPRISTTESCQRYFRVGLRLGAASVTNHSKTKSFDRAHFLEFDTRNWANNLYYKKRNGNLETRRDPVNNARGKLSGLDRCRKMIAQRVFTSASAA